MAHVTGVQTGAPRAKEDVRRLAKEGPQHHVQAAEATAADAPEAAATDSPVADAFHVGN